MKDYVKPVVLVNEELAEGVYAASGAGKCWTVAANSVQNYVDGYNVFEVSCQHTTAVKHISGETTVTLTFNSPIANAYAESKNFACSISGSTVKVTRTLLANAYGSGDDVTYKVWVSTGDEATTKALTCTATIECEHETNVQGELD